MTELNQDIIERVSRVLVEHAGVSPDAIRLDSRLHEDLGMDSLDAMDLLVTINDIFHTDIEPDAMAAVQTLSDLVTLIAHAKSR